VRHVKRPDNSEADLEKTDELPSLDVSSYEAQLRSASPEGELPASGVADTFAEKNRTPPLTELSPAETLKDIEAWVAEQDARAREYERVLAELQAARNESQARADSLALELEGAQKALHTALSRANDGERAALDHDTRARAAESRTAELQIELDEARREIAAAVARIAATTTELALANESLAAKTQQHDGMRLQHAELARVLAERSERMTQVESDLASLHTQIAQANGELAQRAEHLAAIQKENETRLAEAHAVAQERDALAMRIASLLENVQSSEWKRNVWEGIWHELDSELADARTVLARVEAERADLAATVEKVSAQLSERDAAIAHLEADRAAQALALADLNTTRSREQESYAVRTQELRVHGEVLAAQIESLEKRWQRSTELVAAREQELAEMRAVRTSLEDMLRSAQAGEVGHAARVAELETLTSNLGHALQAQTDATTRANALIEARERELMDEQARARELETQVQAALRQATDLTAAAKSTEAALGAHREELALSQMRVASFEREATSQSERLASLQAELAQAKALAEQAETSRKLIEDEVERLRRELQRESERAATLDDTQRKLALELERTRGALDERELQLRRLERYATSTSQVLSRIRVGIVRGEGSPASQAPEYPHGNATLVPLDDSDAPALPLGQHTTIGRAPESDLCLTDSSVSRRHAIVTIGPNGAFIEDAQSVNGVTVNRRRVHQARLADGDVIELGIRRFRFTTSLIGTKAGGSRAPSN